ncbi:thymidylate synthase [Herminiimonas aquatilis]|uniref:Thymidylate synthase n=1 Tax=Herminiimonas aquatilis TaxID=345342 RepID=A0ABW2J799_9BURK
MTKLLPATIGPLLVNETNLSRAWAKIFLHILDHSGHEITPLVLSLTGFDNDGAPKQEENLYAALDKLLSSKKQRTIEDVAYTIFPQRMWKIANGDRAKLFALYRDAFPRYQAMNPKGNNRGLYFERLISYGRGRCEGNQLEWIISQFNSRPGVRRSMFQASVFDPERDHIPDAQLQFPCLQQISFEPTPEGLVINAFYATQQVLVKAYGNYLGIAQLGAFIAHEMKTKLVRMNVTVGIAKVMDLSRNSPDMLPLIAAARECIASEK